ncbi:MAG: tetratricopeptide repeat protein [Proteobacteria bacterium]|nr:tetratricopeptide repeat protein [Pseudomonadota bacterium]MBI3499554.1 tetratricopeptide repeat protein [Pseudomonadota bacterium]
MVSLAEALATAAREHQAGRLDVAEPLYRRVLESEPGNTVALYLLGTLALQLGRPAEADLRIAEAARLEPTVPDFHATLAEAKRQQGDLGAALAGYRRALALAPGEKLRLAQLGEIHRGMGGLALAALAYRRAAAPSAGFAEAYDALGTVERGRGRIAAALTAYRRALAWAPAHAGAGSNLGAALDEARGPADAIPWFHRALAQRSDQAELHLNLGNARRQLQEIEAALAAYRRTLALAPGLALAHGLLGQTEGRRALSARALSSGRRALAIAPTLPDFHAMLAQSLQGAGRIAEATSAERRALSLDPGRTLSLGQLGNLLQDLEEYESAGVAYERYLAIEPGNPDAHMALSYISRLRDDLPAARAHRLAALASKRIYTELCLADPTAPTVLLLMSPDDVNVPFGALLTRDNFTLHKFVLLDVGEGEAPPVLPAFDAIFNGIGEPDKAERGLALASTFLASRPEPRLNHPEAVRGTTRDRMARLLAGIEGGFVPVTVRVTRADLAPHRLEATLAATGLAMPILVRPFGAHGGDDLVRIDAPAAMMPFLRDVAGREFYLTQFVDFRSADGYYRKYRVAFVDGRPYPYHLAIYEDWKVHYYRTKMRETEWMKDEEHRFLADLDEVFGAKATAALQEIARLVPLDYFGIDCTLTRDGRLFVFEANATMLVHLNDSKTDFPYKHVYVPRIVEAFKTMIAQRIAAGG